MLTSTLLLAPFVILGLVLLLGFVGCDKWPGVGANGTAEGQVLLVVKAPQPGPGVTEITDVTFTVLGPNGGPCNGPDGESLDTGPTIQATASDHKTWGAALSCGGPPVQTSFEITPFVVYNASVTNPDDPAPVQNANLSKTYTKDWTGATNTTWVWNVMYRPENWGSGAPLYQLEDATP
jgi:hypothetical protein